MSRIVVLFTNKWTFAAIVALGVAAELAPPGGYFSSRRSSELVTSPVTKDSADSIAKPPTVSSQRPAPPPHDDLTLFISRYGPPDSDTSSENEKPRPPIVSRFLDYDKENVRAIYTADASPGSPPPYKAWNLFAFTEKQTGEPITPKEVTERLAGRDRKK